MEGIVENLVSCGLGGLECFHRIKMRNRAFDLFRWHKNMTFASPVDRTSTEKDFCRSREDTAQIEETKLIGLDVK